MFLHSWIIQQRLIFPFLHSFTKTTTPIYCISANRNRTSWPRCLDVPSRDSLSVYMITTNTNTFKTHPGILNQHEAFLSAMQSQISTYTRLDISSVLKDQEHMDTDRVINGWVLTWMKFKAALNTTHLTMWRHNSCLRLFNEVNLCKYREAGVSLSNKTSLIYKAVLTFCSTVFQGKPAVTGS